MLRWFIVIASSCFQRAHLDWSYFSSSVVYTAQTAILITVNITLIRHMQLAKYTKRAATSRNLGNRIILGRSPILVGGATKIKFISVMISRCISQPAEIPRQNESTRFTPTRTAVLAVFVIPLFGIVFAVVSVICYMTCTMSEQLTHRR